MKLDEVCEVVRGSSPRPKSDPRFYGGSVPRLMVADLTRDGKLVSARIDSLTELGAKQSRPMYQGDVVIAVSGAPGLPAILAHDACIHDGFVGLRNLDQKRINADFLYAYLTFARATSNGKAVGAIFKNLTTDQIKDIEVPDLPVAEQRRIAKVLDRAEALRAKRRAALAQLDSLTQSFFLDLFGDPAINSKGWPTMTLDDLCRGITDIDHKMPIAVEEGVPFISAKDLSDDGRISFENVKRISQEDFRRLSRKSKPEKGDIIYSRIGVNLGKARMVEVDFDFLASYSCCTIKPNREFVDATYLCSLLDSPFILRQAHKGVRAIAVPDLGMGEIKAFRMIVPPVELQREFARRVQAVEKLKTAQRASLAELDALFASLQHRAFRGEL